MEMQVEMITRYIDQLIQPTGFPPWAFLTICACGIIFIYFYIIKFPLSFIRLKKKVAKQSEIIRSLIKVEEDGYQKKGPKYKWKTR
jgi:hypothetical protein